VDVAGGGYLNFHVDRGAFALGLARSIAQRRFGRISSPEATGKIIVEHTNINPNKAAHIGHLRNATLGDSFVRCCDSWAMKWKCRIIWTTPEFRSPM